MALSHRLETREFRSEIAIFPSEGKAISAEKVIPHFSADSPYEKKSQITKTIGSEKFWQAESNLDSEIFKGKDKQGKNRTDYNFGK